VWGLPEFAVRGGGAPVAVIRPNGVEAWVLATKFDSIGAIYATPDPDLVCVMDRLRSPILVDVRDPAKQASLPIAPVRVAAALDEQFLLFADWQKVTAWGVGGIRWVSEPIYGATERYEVTLDAATGSLVP